MKEGNNYLLLPPRFGRESCPRASQRERETTLTISHTRRRRKRWEKVEKRSKGSFTLPRGERKKKETGTHNSFPCGVSYYCSSRRNCAGIALHMVIYAGVQWCVHIRERTCCVVCPQFQMWRAYKVRFLNLGKN